MHDAAPGGYRQREHLADDTGLIASKPEDHWFERKGIRVEAAALANALVGFVNADGGTVLIGVEDDGTVTGVDANPDRDNDLRQAALDHTTPTVRHEISTIPCVNREGAADHLLVFEVPPSDNLHANRRGEVYRRVGDQNRRLSLDEVQELRFDKGDRPFDGTRSPMPPSTTRIKTRSTPSPSGSACRTTCIVPFGSVDSS